MKKFQVDKLARQLVAIEEELVSELRKSLPSAVETGVDLFSLDWNPNEAYVGKLRDLSRQIENLRVKLSLDIVGTPCELYRRGCIEAEDACNVHRRGPKRLAEWLLSEIRDS